MVAPRVSAARSYADELTQLLGRVVTVDPAEAAANLPAVLILPPELTFDRLSGPTASVTWRLVVLTRPPGGLAAWEQLDELLDELAEHSSITTATPAQYTLNGERDPFPAYMCTATD